MDTATSKRLQRYRRHRFGKPVFVLTERDRAIVQLVSDYRLMSSDLIERLVGGSRQNLRRRLQFLYHAKYLDRPPNQRYLGNIKMMYAAGARAHHGDERHARAGHQRTENNRTIRVPYIEHALMVSAFRTALTLATVGTDVSIERWLQGDKTRDYVMVDRAHGVERVPVCPDAQFTLKLQTEPEGQNRIHAFLEADRSTMTVERFMRKLRGYCAYRNSGRQEQRYGMKNFLVVTVTRSEERARHLIKAASALDMPNAALRMFLFASEHKYLHGARQTILASIWHAPGDDAGHSLVD